MTNFNGFTGLEELSKKKLNPELVPQFNKKEMNLKEAIVWKAVGAIDDAIKEAGEDGIPSGHLYAAVMGHMNLDTYNGIIDILKKAGKVKEENFLLKSLK